MKMETMTIKEAAKKLQVEAHVLRYWEDELKLDIKRNAQGHRYYDDRDIRMFEQVKLMKEEGLMLKDIRNAIARAKRELLKSQPLNSSEAQEYMEHQQPSYDDEDSMVGRMKKIVTQNEYAEKIEHSGTGKQHANNCEQVVVNKDNVVKCETVITGKEKVVDFKQAQLQTVMNRVIANALRENKDIITTSIKQEITADVMRQFDTVMREKEEREEERYRRLDEVLREIQRANVEVAATKPHKRFGKNRR